MKFGLIGYPIAHSLSPSLFKAGYDGAYQYELIETSDFEEAYQRFLDGYDGINVTAPFKELAFRKADILSEECQRIGATNLLIKTPEGVKAYNSDYLGVRMWISEISADMQKIPTVLIVGLGGAGKAAAEAARSLGCRTILINRTLFHEDIRPLEDFCKCFKEADIIIYNIPAGIPQLDNLTDEDIVGTNGGSKHILEANYKDPSINKTLINKLISLNHGSSYTSGKTWLLYQAVTGYEIFTGEKPDLVKMSALI
jgi:shikimate dehydrogenase